MTLTAPLILQAYQQGYFPMADSRDDHEIFWVKPRIRYLLPLNISPEKRFHISKSLKKSLLKKNYYAACNQRFSDVIHHCATVKNNARTNTWINIEIEKIYNELHHLGHAHSVEIYDKGDDSLIGGLYGLAIGGAFFGESMFSSKSNASKMALCHLIMRLIGAGYILCDAQFENPHLQQFGAYSVPDNSYMQQLKKALTVEKSFAFDPIIGINEMSLFLND